MTAAAVARIPPANPGPLPYGLDALAPVERYPMPH